MAAFLRLWAMSPRIILSLRASRFAPWSPAAVLPILAGMILTGTLYRPTGRCYGVGFMEGFAPWTIHDAWARSLAAFFSEGGKMFSV